MDQYLFSYSESLSFKDASWVYEAFPYKINNNLNGSFSFNTTTDDTAPKQYLYWNDVIFSLCDSSYVGNNMKRYTYRIHWGKNLGMYIKTNGMMLYWDRCGTYTDELLNYEDTELIEAVRNTFNADKHKFCSYSFENENGNSNIDAMLNYNLFSPTIYAVFAMNANDNNFMSCPLYNAMYLGSYNTPVINQYTSIVMVPIMEMEKFTMGKFTQESIQNSVQDIYTIQNDVNFAKKFLGYYKAPTAFNLNDAGNYFANWFNASSQISSAGLRYCNFGLTGNVQKKCIAFQMVMVSYINNFRIPFNIPITTDYNYQPPQQVSQTQLEHLHLTQIFKYKIGATSVSYPHLLAQFGLDRTTWNTNLSTYYYNAGKVNMGFADGFIIQSPTNSETKIYYGSTLPYIYDGYVDWNIQNRTALNAKVNYGLSGLIGNVFGTISHLVTTGTAATSPGTLTAGGSYQDSLQWGRTTAYNALQWIKGAPNYGQQIRQAQISNPANLITNADASGSYADLMCYFDATYNRRAIPFEMSTYNGNAILFANNWLRQYGFGGVSRYTYLDNSSAFYSGYARLSKNPINFTILKDQFSSTFASWCVDKFKSQFIVGTIDEVINEAYEWLCGGYYS